MEEAGIELEDIQQFYVTNDIFENTGKHYVTLCLQGRAKSAEFTNMEPHKHEQFAWVSWDDLPQPLFLAVQNMVDEGVKPSYLDQQRNAA